MKDIKDIQYIILRVIINPISGGVIFAKLSGQIKKNTIIYEVRKIESGEVKWVYQEDIDDKYVPIEEYRDLIINRILL